MIDRDDPSGPQRNRVAPDGTLIATRARGLCYGVRGCLHDRDGFAPRGDRLRWVGRRWLICALRYKDRRRPIAPPGAYSGLYFLDEATGLAAGHRPCALCRRADYNAYRRFAGVAELGADAMDLQLHAERLDGRRRRLHALAWRGLPPGAVVILDGAPHLALADALLPWRPEGYGPALRRPQIGDAVALTPPTSLQALRTGFKPKLHPSASVSA